MKRFIFITLALFIGAWSALAQWNGLSVVREATYRHNLVKLDHVRVFKNAETYAYRIEIGEDDENYILTFENEDELQIFRSALTLMETKYKEWRSTGLKNKVLNISKNIPIVAPEFTLETSGGNVIKSAEMKAGFEMKYGICSVTLYFEAGKDKIIDGLYLKSALEIKELVGVLDPSKNKDLDTLFK